MNKQKNKGQTAVGTIQTAKIGDVVCITAYNECVVGFVYNQYNNPWSIYLSKEDPLQPISVYNVFDRSHSSGYGLDNIVSCEILKRRSDSEREEGLCLRNRLEEFKITKEGLVDTIDPFNHLTYFKPKYGKVVDAKGRNIVIVYPENNVDEPEKVIEALKRKKLLRKLGKNNRMVISITGILHKHFNLLGYDGKLKEDNKLRQEIQLEAYEKHDLQFADSYLISERTPGDDFNSFIGKATGIYFQAQPPKAIVKYFRTLEIDR